MGNASSSPSDFATGAIFKNKDDLVRAANEHNHGVGGGGDWKNFKKKEYESLFSTLVYRKLPSQSMGSG
eukprot:scaffold104578_cov67-Attheya_sp.AAC.2